jgi:hypothetical protein
MNDADPPLAALQTPGKENLMAETDPSPNALPNPVVPDLAAEERPKTPEPVRSFATSSAEEPSARNTKGVLRDAIQKVMEEIAFHEQAAKKHLQQADELRKDLRESFAFLQDREGKSKAPLSSAGNLQGPPAEPPTKEKLKDGTTAEARPRGNPKKKSGGKGKDR